MLTYLLRRIFVMIPTMLGITFLTFLIISLAPGDPVALQAGGAGESADGGGEAQARKADAIKAKKKLLGIVEPEHVLRRWDVVREAPPLRADGSPGQPGKMTRTATTADFGTWARCATMDAGAKRAWVGTATGGLVAIDLETGEDISSFRPETFPTEENTSAAELWAVAASSDGALVAAADSRGRLRVWSGKDGATVATPAALPRAVRDIEFLPGTEQFLTACDDGAIRLYDGRSGEELKRYSGHTSFVGAVAVAPGGKSFYSAGYDRKLRVWDVAAGTATVLTEASAGVNSIALDAAGARLAVGGEDRGATVYELAGTSAPKVLCELKGIHPRAVTAVGLSGDGKFLVTASKDGSARTWQTDTGLQTAQAPDNTNGPVYAILFTPGGDGFWTASESDRKTPVWKRYGTWLWKTVRLDFDRSFISDEKVMDMIADRLPVTIWLNVMAIFIIYSIAVPIGVLSAVKRGKAFDRGASLTVFLLWSLPNFWFATLLIQFFSSPNHWDIFPSVGLSSQNANELSFLQGIGDLAAHLVLPAIVLTYAGFAGLSQYMRTSVLETISQDFIRTARAKGLSERVVVYKHALRNSLITLVTIVGTMLPGMIGGSVIVERIFTIDGMGYMGFEAIQQRDYPVIMAVTTMSAVLTLIGMLVSDILYAVVDPRISHS